MPSFRTFFFFFLIDRINTNAPVAPPTAKINPSAASLMTTSLTPNNTENGEKKKEEPDEVWGYLEAQSSFLGPSLWDNGDLKVRFDSSFLIDFLPVASLPAYRCSSF